MIRELKPDVVWFNLLFSTFGSNPLAAFAGLTIPLSDAGCREPTPTSLCTT